MQDQLSQTTEATTEFKQTLKVTVTLELPWNADSYGTSVGKKAAKAEQQSLGNYENLCNALQDFGFKVKVAAKRNRKKTVKA